MNKLYNIFKEKWLLKNNSQIFFYSDPHFGDLESYKLRFPEITKAIDILVSKNALSEEEATKQAIVQLDQIQINNINKVCHKNDCLVILGDVGNVECIRRLKAGHKVLILGNHDKGASYYKRLVEHSVVDTTGKSDTEIEKISDAFCTLFGVISVKQSYKDNKITYDVDNHLFDEVYEGTLQISPKIILSHEPVEYKYCLNIHGHVHPDHKLTEVETAYHEEVARLLDCTFYYYNCCAEWINYTPISLNSILESGIMKKIPDIHRETIDRATEKRNESKAHRFLAFWDCTTGLPTSNPSDIPFSYQPGDYFSIIKVGTINYKPDGLLYNNIPSTVVYNDKLTLFDFWVYDGINWNIKNNSRKGE